MSRMTVAANLARGVSHLRYSTPSPQLEAELLLAHVLRCSRAHLYAHSERCVQPYQQSTYEALLTRRACGEPLPYLTGSCEFYGLDVLVNRCVLIPRPETETLVDLVLNHIAQPRSDLAGGSPKTEIGRDPVLADVCTGSGCIALALAVHAPLSYIYALDIAPDALAVAYANAHRHGVTGRISFIQSDLLSALQEPVDLIVCNPPYIALDEWSMLPRGVREYEPQLGLYGGTDGLQVTRRLLDQAPSYLRPRGSILVEIGAKQGDAATSLARKAFPTAIISVHKDLAGHDRVLCIVT